MGLIGRKAARLVNPLNWLAIWRVRAADRAFDRSWGGDTSGSTVPDKSDVQGANWLHGHRYQAMDPESFLKIIGGLNLPCPEFVFVDLGSGKGRAVLLASHFDFAEIIGVEYSKALHAAALKNLENWPAQQRRCGPIRFLWQDAGAFNFPEVPLVLFLYNPFGRPVMEKVTANLAASLRRVPRRILVIYFRPECADLWDAIPGLHPVHKSVWCSVYDTSAPSP